MNSTVEPRLSVGDRISQAREDFGLSQAQLSHHLAVTRAAVSLYEKDKIRPRPDIFQALAAFFSADPEWFEWGHGRAPDSIEAKPATTFGALPGVQSHMIAITAPNDVGSIQAGDKVLVDPLARDGAGVFLVIDPAKGSQLRACETEGARIVGRVVGFYRAL